MRMTLDRAKALANANRERYGEAFSVYKSRDGKQLNIRVAADGRRGLPEGSYLIYRTRN
jgi:hypothetical protein